MRRPSRHRARFKPYAAAEPKRREGEREEQHAVCSVLCMLCTVYCVPVYACVLCAVWYCMLIHRCGFPSSSSPTTYHPFFLSSYHSGTRFQQSAVGTLFTSAIREDLNVDAAILNGATIKGNRLYEGRVLTYADLKKELPFPTKMVSVPMPGHVLEAAIQHVSVKWFISC